MEESSKGQWTGLLIAIIVLLGIGYVVGSGQVSTPTEQTQDTSQETLIETTVVQSVSYQGEDGKSVYELLKTSHQVEAQESEAGVFVTSIDGIGGDTDTYWLYYVNGEPAAMAADKVMTQTGQTIEWRYEKF